MQTWSRYAHSSKWQNGMQTQNELQVTNEVQIFISSVVFQNIIMNICNQKLLLLHHMFHRKKHGNPSCFHVFQQKKIFLCKHNIT
jgi:hypothetical protein